MAKISNSARRVLTIAVVGTGSLTLLFWAKLRLMTQVPRAAYAEPETTAPTDLPADPSAIDADQAGDHSASPELVDSQDDTNP